MKIITFSLVRLPTAHSYDPALGRIKEVLAIGQTPAGVILTMRVDPDDAAQEGCTFTVARSGDTVQPSSGNLVTVMGGGPGSGPNFVFSTCFS